MCDNDSISLSLSSSTYIFMGKCYMNIFYSYTPLYTPCIRDILVSSSFNHTFSSIYVESRLSCVKILCGCKRCIATWGWYMYHHSYIYGCYLLKNEFWGQNSFPPILILAINRESWMIQLCYNSQHQFHYKNKLHQQNNMYIILHLINY